MAADISALAAAVGVIITVVIYLVEARRREVAARAEGRLQSVEAVLAALGDVLQSYASPAGLKMQSKPIIALTLSVQRFLLRLEKSEAPVGAWAQAQVSQMQLARTDHRLFAVAGNLAGKLFEWHAGQRDTAWFARQADTRSPRPTARALKSARNSRTWAFTGQRTLSWSVATLFITPALAFTWATLATNRQRAKR